LLHGLLDRRLGIHAVLVVEIDVVDAEPLERGVDRGADVLGAAVDPPLRRVRAGGVAELRREHDLVPPPGDRLADKPLVVAELLPVYVGGVEKGDPELERAVDRRDRLLFVDLAVPGRHAHAAQPQRRHDQSLSKRSRFHTAPRTVPGRSSPRMRPSSELRSRVRNGYISPGTGGHARPRQGR
jgi:hypothetical protein